MSGMTPIQNQEIPECSICLEPMEKSADEKGLNTLELKCNHIFHKACIEPWLSARGTCPMCRNTDVFSDSTTLPHHVSLSQNNLADLFSTTNPRSFPILPFFTPAPSSASSSLSLASPARFGAPTYAQVTTSNNSNTNRPTRHYPGPGGCQ